MPKRADINTILIIGSGPIIIGQACEFDYSGTQACKALRGLGYKIILVNSNPATIMTDPVVADITYIEPLNVARLAEIIDKERPDALLPNLGGQSALNLSFELKRAGVLDKYGVKVIGVQLDAIERGEDRIEFKNAMDKLGVEIPESHEALSVEQAVAAADKLGYPVVIRPAYTMGGTGGGIVYNKEELQIVVSRGIQASMIGQVLVEESVLGWEELEVEVVRDANDQMIAVCMIENIDPMGVHTGDSFCVAPMLTISDDVQARLRRIAFDIVSGIGVIGGTNVQFAHDPATGRIVVIEINPRTSRSSALASKATGFPIAYVSAMLAAGLTLDEIPYWRKGALDKYEPYGDYVVLKFARWAFEKFAGIEDRLGTQMRAVGEVMSIGRTFKETFQKAVRSLEIGRSGLGFAGKLNELSEGELMQIIAYPNSERYFAIYETLRKGVSADRIYDITKIKKYFIEQMKELVELEGEILQYKKRVLPDGLLVRAKKDGFADKYLSRLLEVPEEYIRLHRKVVGIEEEWDVVPVSGADAEYFYSTYNGLGKLGGELAASRARLGGKGGAVVGGATTTDGVAMAGGGVAAAKAGGAAAAVNSAAMAGGAAVSDVTVAGSVTGGLASAPRQKVIVLGGGPNRIGQGIEFDYCCVHTAFALREAGFETIMINCNPETVSTDYDTSDRLYFEPLTVEDVLSICKHEQPLGVIVQFGGQTPLNIAMELKMAGAPILGTSPEVIALAEDRDLFRKMMDAMHIPMPESGMARNYGEAVAVAAKIGYPVMVRPSYVLGGRAMEVVYEDEQLGAYIRLNAQYISDEAPILIDRFLDNALECEADALADGGDTFVPAVMEHIEYAGVHSGDSACVIPTINITGEQLDTIRDYSCKIAGELGVVGLMNIQYAIHHGKVYVLEANPRASRTVPLVSKVCNLNMANIATRLIMEAHTGERIDLSAMRNPVIPYYGVKEAVFPFNMFPEVDPVLGPEMRSTGEVLGLSDSFGIAFYKALEGGKTVLPLSGAVLISVAKKDRNGEVEEVARGFESLGFRIWATRGTCAYLVSKGIHAEIINKIYEGRPNIEDSIKNHRLDIIINTPSGDRRSSDDDSYIRKSAIRYNIPYITTLTAALAGVKGIAEKLKRPNEHVCSLQEYHRSVTTEY
ncbi:MAG: carbamoyl-phosphate synthase large subunit [Oscillospiraceae bacterium]|nr:carbamoyl-phosphate synthase large subunit [Oscillospiraceae bacterium]